MPKFICISLVCIVLSGCASGYQLPAGKQSVPMELSFDNPIPDTIFKTATATAHSGGTCTPSPYGLLMEHRLSMQDRDILPTVQIPANEAFTFAIKMAENRGGGLVSHCQVLSTFTPKATEAYRMLYTNRPEGCYVEVRDRAGQQVPLIKAPYACDQPGEKPVPNGKRTGVQFIVR